MAGTKRWFFGWGLLAVAILAVAGRGGQAVLAASDRLAQAETLRVISTRDWALGLLWQWSFLLVLLQSGAAAALHRRIAARVARPWLADALFFALLALLLNVTLWPLAYRTGHLVSRRFGLSVQSTPAWLSDRMLAAAVDLVLTVPTLLVLYALLRRWPRRWWVAASGLGAVAVIVMSMLWPVVIAPLFNRYEPVRDQAILDRVARLSAVSGVPIGEVLRVDLGRRTTAANGWVAGLWGTRRVVLGDTLLDRYTPAEIEAVLAHELGHVVHNDVWWGTLALAAGQAAALFVVAHGAARLVGRWGRRWGLDHLADPASAPLIFLIVGLLTVAGMPVINAGSRWRERAADRYALQTTSDPAALADFFAAVAAQNLSDPAPPRWYVWLFMTHPPIAERIEMARRFTAGEAP